MTKIERAFTDQLFFPFLVCQVSNGVDLSRDTFQIEWHQCHDETETFNKKIFFLDQFLKILTNLVAFPDHNLSLSLAHIT